MEEILKCDHSNESYTERYVPVVLFIALYKVFLTFESVDKRKQLSGFSCGTVYYAVQGGSKF